MPNIKIIAKTDRLLIQSLSENDITAIATIWTDPAVTQYMGGPRDFQKVAASLKEELANAPDQKFDLWPVLEKTSGKVIGHCGLLPKEIDGQDEVELIYVVAADAWGRGYATEAAKAICDHAFRKLECKRLVALIDPANAGSERVALKTGMRLEKETVRPNGKRMSVYVLTA